MICLIFYVGRILSFHLFVYESFFFCFVFLKVPDYYDIIKKPIALNIIREKVNKCEYKLACKYYLLKEVMRPVFSL